MRTPIPTVIPLWPDGAPGSETWPQVEPTDILPPDTPVVRNVTQPTLTAYLPAPARLMAPLPSSAPVGHSTC